jgi:hypothetical protein
MTRKDGTPPNGGTGGGVIFRFDPTSGAYDVLHTFTQGDRSDGDTNDHGFLRLVDGVAYATTELGGAALQGTLFSIREDGSDFTILHSFGATDGDGAKPFGSLLLLDGWLYGTDAAYEVLASFDRKTSGAFPEDDLVASADGRFLYGLTQAGGVNDPDATAYDGTVFRFAVP